MKAILIPANISEPVREIDFDPDKSWRYVVTRYDPGAPSLATDVAFLTKENAPRDYLMRNSRASEFVRSKLAANGRTDGLGSPEDLYGDVVVLGYDKPFEMLTDVPGGVDPDDFDPFGLGPVGSVSPDLDDFEPGDSLRMPNLDPENSSIPVRSTDLDDFDPDLDPPKWVQPEPGPPKPGREETQEPQGPGHLYGPSIDGPGHIPGPGGRS